MSSHKYGIVLVFTAFLSVTGQNRVAVAQGEAETSAPLLEDLANQVNALQDEVQFLRARQESVVNPLPAAEIIQLNDSSLLVEDDFSPVLFEPAQQTFNALSCDGTCFPNSCSCPLPQAPCIDCPRVSTLSPYFNVSIFGALKLDMLYSKRRPFSPGTPFFLLPESMAGFDENTFDMHARQSTLGAAFTGPQFNGLQSGGMVVAMFFNDAVVVDQYGFLPLQAFGELKNEDWRFSAGLQFDVFSPGIPTVLPFSALGASGNTGNSFRGQVRLERFLQTDDDMQWTLQVALSEPIASSINPEFRLSEDNGWPNVEGRIALGLGSVQGVGAAAKRPFEVGLSGVVGEIRTTIPAMTQVVADVWGASTDFRWSVNDMFGFSGELFTGQTLGTYNGGILQNVNPTTFDGIKSSGGWFETYVYWTPSVHSHIGYGIDDPDNGDIAPGGQLKNETYYANLLWDMNATFRIAYEFTWRKTEYSALRDIEGAGLHTQFQWSF